jgi:hypothetical protein
VVLGDLVPVSGTTGRLADLARRTTGPAVIGLVWDMRGDTTNPASLDELAAWVPPFPVPVGYAAPPLPAVRLYDSAANISGTTDYQSVVIAVVDAHGKVTRFLTALDPDSGAGPCARSFGD